MEMSFAFGRALKCKACCTAPAGWFRRRFETFDSCTFMKFGDLERDGPPYSPSTHRLDETELRSSLCIAYIHNLEESHRFNSPASLTVTEDARGSLPTIVLETVDRIPAQWIDPKKKKCIPDIFSRTKTRQGTMPAFRLFRWPRDRQWTLNLPILQGTLWHSAEHFHMMSSR